MEFPELKNTYQADLTIGKTSLYILQYVVFQEVENLLLSIAYEGKYIDAQGSRRVEHITVENESLLLN